MSFLCALFGHDYKEYEKNPHLDEDCGVAAQCRRCSHWEWDYK